MSERATEPDVNAPAGRELGRVHTFDRARGFGFVESAAGERFAVGAEHVAPRALPLAPGEVVMFDVAPGSPHRRAVNVRLAPDAALPEPLAPEDGLSVGVVSEWHEAYGRIVAADGTRYFAHADDLLPGVLSLRVGQRVQFEPGANARGPRARRVRPLDGQATPPTGQAPPTVMSAARDSGMPDTPAGYPREERRDP